MSGDNLHEMSNPVLWDKIRKNITAKLSSAELVQKVIKVKLIKFGSIHCVI